MKIEKNSNGHISAVYLMKADTRMWNIRLIQRVYTLKFWTIHHKSCLCLCLLLV